MAIVYRSEHTAGLCKDCSALVSFQNILEI